MKRVCLLVLPFLLLLMTGAAIGSPAPGSTITQSVVFDADVDATGVTGTVYTIGADGITVDGAGHTIYAPDANKVFDFSGRTGVRITNFVLETSSTYAISAGNASSSTIDACTITTPEIAISLQECSGITVSGVTANGASYGVSASRTSDSLVENCDLQSSVNYGVGFSHEAHRNTVRGNALNGSRLGVHFEYDSDDNLVENNTATGCDVGIEMRGGGERNVIRGNDLSGSLSRGILIDREYGGGVPTNFQITGNTLDGSTCGLDLKGVLAPQIEGNTYHGAETGILLTNCSGETIGPAGNIRDWDFTSIGRVTNTALHLSQCSHMTVSGLRAEGALRALVLGGTTDTLVEDCRLDGPGTYAIGIFNASNRNTYQDNQLGDYTFGFYVLHATEQNLFEGNQVTGCDTGIRFWTSGQANVLQENTFQGGTYGVYLSQAADTVVWHNNIYQNRLNLFSDLPMDLSQYNQGNFWGHSCPILFFPDVDTNELNIVDSHPYGQLDAWHLGIPPGGCNQPPVAEAGPDQEVEVTSVEGAEVTLDGSGSYDPDNDPLAHDWDFDHDGFYDASGEVVVETFAEGIHTVTLRVTDTSGLSDTDDVQIIVRDTTPPEPLSVAADPRLLWPPNHQMAHVEILIQLADAGDPEPEASIVAVISSEPVTGEGDNTSPDWVLTGPLTVLLRAERGGDAPGRIYTIYVDCTDDAGNVTTVETQVLVPHDLGRK